MEKNIELVKKLETILDMKYLLKFSRKTDEFVPGLIIKAFNKMDNGYTYKLTNKIGDIDHPDFNPYFNPGEMLEMGIFEGKYLNDCILEFPKEWFENAIKSKTLSPEKSDINCNCFSIKSRLSRSEWIKNGWIPQIDEDPDNRGWFQWYCRYYIGRRIPEIDDIQIKRWKAFKRHYGQVRKNCDEINCRPKQRQALLQWAYNAFVTTKSEL